MGKTQSKRSVDITTETKKGPEEEVTGKLEKIEDIDQKQANGDATPQENIDAEKKEHDESENDKDLTTEKSGEAAQAGGDNASENNTSSPVVEPGKDESATPKEGAATEEISPLSDDSMKKAKKEKQKRKWSFRSISFGKKDKQKPSKTEEATENVAAATNGDAEKSATDEVSESKNEGAEGAVASDVEAKGSDEKLENGNATESELNGQKTPISTPTGEKPDEAIVIESTTNATTDTTNANVPAATNETATQIQTKTATNTVDVVEATVIAATISNGVDASAVEKNVVAEVLTTEENTEKSIDKAETEVSAALTENIKTIPNVINEEKPHQNGTNAVDETEADAEKSKSQIEVNTSIDNINTTQNIPSFQTTMTTTSSDPYAQTINTNNASDVINEVETVKTVVDTMTSVDDAAANVIVAATDVDIENIKPNVDNKLNSQYDTQPPPLPISPPPSHVSVFAFKNNSETDEISTEQTIAVNTMSPETSPPCEQFETKIETVAAEVKTLLDIGSNIDQAEVNAHVNDEVNTEVTAESNAPVIHTNEQKLEATNIQVTSELNVNSIISDDTTNVLPEPQEDLSKQIEQTEQSEECVSKVVDVVTKEEADDELLAEKLTINTKCLLQAILTDGDIENPKEIQQVIPILAAELSKLSAGPQVEPTIIDPNVEIEQIQQIEEIEQEVPTADTTANINESTEEKHNVTDLYQADVTAVIEEEIPTETNETKAAFMENNVKLSDKPLIVSTEQIREIQLVVDDVTEQAVEEIERKLREQNKELIAEENIPLSSCSQFVDIQTKLPSPDKNEILVDYVDDVLADFDSNQEKQETDLVVPTIVAENLETQNIIPNVAAEVIPETKQTVGGIDDSLVSQIEKLSLSKDEDGECKESNTELENNIVNVTQEIAPISLTKEVANVKELKENAAAENTTQDLPVTCE
ncbi:A-kinase anchor protein 200 [Teleopsis dalmanni]|uniref:A-kinase anchor protein 200 n=1 Tax=Teleopsis dalmanni TaxID=139649 RepID=UPI0018CD6BAC|nr:A-kinase anchor protein 200 [Teleopsis dalmanni]XP_037957266.1 A-kinase anchor protein 200 [Teleopsis dalmanni]